MLPLCLCRLGPKQGHSSSPSLSPPIPAERSAAEWLNKNKVLINKLAKLKKTSNARKKNRSEALFKAWSANVFVPLTFYIKEKSKEERRETRLTQFRLYQQFLDGCASPKAIHSTMYQSFSNVYDPYVLTRDYQAKVIHPPLKDPLFLWTKEQEEERLMLRG